MNEPTEDQAPEGPVDRKARDIEANREAGLISEREAQQQREDVARYREEGPRGDHQAPERPADEGVSPDDPEPPTTVDSQENGEGEGAPDSDGPDGDGQGHPAGALAEINFASDTGAELAADLGLADADFEGISPSGSGGFTADDVREAADRRAGGDEE